MTEPVHRDDRCAVYLGDCVGVMGEMAADSVDAIVTDPPYDLTSIVKRFGKEGAAPAKAEGMGGAYSRLSKGFMGMQWDGTGVAFRAETWRAALRVTRPGGYLVAFGGTRTHHRMMVAIEDAGWEIRDTIGYGHGGPDTGLCAWVHGQGFPKTKNHLKPAWEPIVLARKPLSEPTVAANVLKHGAGAINVDGCRIEGAMNGTWGARQLSSIGYGGTEPTDYRTQPHEAGRWPPNVCLDEDAAALLDAQSGETPSNWRADKGNGIGRGYGHTSVADHAGPRGQVDTGGASRFFPVFKYEPKASSSERRLQDGSRGTHPTQKPVGLLRWLVRLVTPPGGTVLDCFAGSGTTRLAALAEGFSCVLIEKEAAYLEQLCGRAAQQGLPLDTPPPEESEAPA